MVFGIRFDPVDIVSDATPAWRWRWWWCPTSKRIDWTHGSDPLRCSHDRSESTTTTPIRYAGESSSSSSSSSSLCTTYHCDRGGRWRHVSLGTTTTTTRRPNTRRSGFESSPQTSTSFHESTTTTTTTTTTAAKATCIRHWWLRYMDLKNPMLYNFL